MRHKRSRRRGSGVLEFTLVGIPLMFVLISTIEMSRGMWIYHTLGYAIKEGTRYAVVHGQNCALPPNSCTVTIANIAGVIQSAGVGLSSSDLTLTFTSADGSSTTCTSAGCQTGYTTSKWPSSANNVPGMKLKIAGSYPFSSVICMFWPGAGHAQGYMKTFTLTASSRESIQF